MFQNGFKVRPLAEELMEEGLHPDKVLGEIDRNIALMESGPHAVSASGLPAGTKTPRTLSEVGKGLIAENEEPEVDEGEDLDEAVKGKRMKSKAQRAKNRRGAAYKRKLRKAKMYKRRNKAKIKRARKKAIRKAGGAKALAKKRAAAAKSNKRLQITGLDVLANLAEELEANGAGQESTHVSPYAEAVLDAGYLCHLLGEIFECYGDDRAAEALFRVGDYAAGLSEALDSLTEDEDLTEDQEADVKRVLEATQKALAAWEQLGSPTLPEAIEAMDEDALDEGDKKMEKDSKDDDSDEDESDDDDDSDDDDEDDED